MEQKATQVTVQIDNLASEILKLENVVDALRERLSQVIRDDDHTIRSDDEDIKTEAVLVPLAHGIRNCQYQVKNVYVKIDDILSKLEL